MTPRLPQTSSPTTVVGPTKVQNKEKVKEVQIITGTPSTGRKPSCAADAVHLAYATHRTSPRRKRCRQPMSLTTSRNMTSKATALLQNDRRS